MQRLLQLRPGAAWSEGNTDTPSLSVVRTAEELRTEERSHQIMTVDEAIASWVPGNPLPLHPILGGLPPEFRQRAVERARLCETSVRDVAREHRMSKSRYRRWASGTSSGTSQRHGRESDIPLRLNLDRLLDAFERPEPPRRPLPRRPNSPRSFGHPKGLRRVTVCSDALVRAGVPSYPS